MDMVSDSDLVIRMYDDDVSAFDVLYWRYHQAIYSNILKFTKDPNAAQDVLQNVFCKLWENRRSMDNQQSVSGWLFVISFHQSVDYMRKNVRESEAVNSFKNSMAIPDEINFNLLEEQYCLLEKAISQLSEQKRKVFTLCKLEGKSYEAAAQELNISKHTVKEYLSLAMLSVKNSVKEHKFYIENLMLLGLLDQWLNALH